MTTCPHSETFPLDGTQRCSKCFTDALTLKDGVLLWPSQDDPYNFSGDQIAWWFNYHRIYLLPQGCDGFTFARNNLAPGGIYGYIWVELTLDLDFEMLYLFDVRRYDGKDEKRQFLFVAYGRNGASHAWHEPPVLFREDGKRHLISGLHWFADQTSEWLEGRWDD